MNIKKTLVDLCQSTIEDRIRSNQEAINRVQAGLHNETKSSAGDKFETTRATLQAEQGRLEGNIIKLKKLEQDLKAVPLTQSIRASPGALVTTTVGTYFISIGLGKLNFSK